jgi:hypothetical protein
VWDKMAKMYKYFYNSIVKPKSLPPLLRKISFFNTYEHVKI